MIIPFVPKTMFDARCSLTIPNQLWALVAFNQAQWILSDAEGNILYKQGETFLGKLVFISFSGYAMKRVAPKCWSGDQYDNQMVESNSKPMVSNP